MVRTYGLTHVAVAVRDLDLEADRSEKRLVEQA